MASSGSLDAGDVLFKVRRSCKQRGLGSDECDAEVHIQQESVTPAESEETDQELLELLYSAEVETRGGHPHGGVDQEHCAESDADQSQESEEEPWSISQKNENVCR